MRLCSIKSFFLGTWFQFMTQIFWTPATLREFCTVKCNGQVVFGGQTCRIDLASPHLQCQTDKGESPSLFFSMTLFTTQYKLYSKNCTLNTAQYTLNTVRQQDKARGQMVVCSIIQSGHLIVRFVPPSPFVLNKKPPRHL